MWPSNLYYACNRGIRPSTASVLDSRKSLAKVMKPPLLSYSPRSRARDKNPERVLNKIRSRDVEQHGTEVAGCAACVPWAKMCIVLIDMVSPRPKARPKCSNCLRGSGKHCSHSDLILDILRFKNYGQGLRIPEYNAFFKNTRIDTWGLSHRLACSHQE